MSIRRSFRRHPTEVLAFLRKVATRARRIAGICTGGFVLAEAGLLANRRATTHWAYAREMMCRFPDIRVEEDRIYIVDGPIWTSAGMTAGLDLALGMVEKDLGADVARSVAHELVMYQRRVGRPVAAFGNARSRAKVRSHPERAELCAQEPKPRAHRGGSCEYGHLSPRQFSRVFTLETGQSPAKAIEGLRLEAARLMIEKSRHSLEVIAKETGFRDRRHMREAFMRGFGLPPQAVRRDAHLDVQGVSRRPVSWALCVTWSQGETCGRAWPMTILAGSTTTVQARDGQGSSTWHSQDPTGQIARSGRPPNHKVTPPCARQLPTAPAGPPCGREIVARRVGTRSGN